MAHPSARLVEADKPRSIAKALKGPYEGKKLTFSAQDILRATQSSVAAMSAAKEIILRGKITSLLHLQEGLEEIAKLLTDLCMTALGVGKNAFLKSFACNCSQVDASYLRIGFSLNIFQEKRDFKE